MCSVFFLYIYNWNAYTRWVLQYFLDLTLLDLTTFSQILGEHGPNLEYHSFSEILFTALCTCFMPANWQQK